MSEWPPERSISFASPSDHQTIVFHYYVNTRCFVQLHPTQTLEPPIFHAKQEESCILFRAGIIWVRRMQRYHEITLWLFFHSVQILDIPQYRLPVL